MRLIILLVASLFMAACHTQKNKEINHSHVVENYFGEGFEENNVKTVSNVIAALHKKDTISGQIRGVIQEVCQVKGCWMTLADSPDSEQNFFVKFKDYGFFVPMDISGRTVILNGQAFKSITPVDELRHYAEDAGKSAEEIAAITQPEEEYKFMASGVYLEL